MKKRIGNFMQDEEGVGTLEMLLIIAVILIIAIAFRKWIMQWVNELFQRTNENVMDTLNENTIEIPE